MSSHGPGDGCDSGLGPAPDGTAAGTRPIRIRREGPGVLTVTDPGGVPLVALEPNEWESRFFARRMGKLSIVAEPAADLPPGGWREAVRLAAAEADSYDLVQLHLDVRHLALAPVLEEAGFRLVDSRISFVTRLDRRLLERPQPPMGEVRLATPQHLPELLALTQRSLTDNPGFHSRYKNPAYFTHEEASRWFAAWLESGLADPTTLIAVWHLEGRAVGFFGYQRVGEREGLFFYKSTLAAVDESRRGHKAHIFMQTTLFDHMPGDEFWVQSTTQLSNTPVIRNNLRLGRRLDRVELTFFRTPRG